MKWLLSLIFLFSFSLEALAAKSCNDSISEPQLSFSEIDTMVRETVAEVYSVLEGDVEVAFDIYEDIWGLELEKNPDPEYCLASVTGYANKPGYYGSSLHQFWVCIVNDRDGPYGEFSDDEQIGD